MSVDAILRRAGFCPQCPHPSPRAGDAETVAPQRVPNLPTVPARKDKGENVGSEQTRAHLLALAEAEGMDAGLVHGMPETDVDACAGLPDATLRAYLTAMQDTADRMAGRIPTGETTPILCAHCGPVWSHPEVAAVLPVVDDWPHALGCPWCHVRKALKAMPRPPVTCATCQHFQPDTLNPDAGMGACMGGHGDHYPNQRHRCGQYRPKENQP